MDPFNLALNRRAFFRKGAFGIGTGILLLAMFGVYEKKKAEVQALLQRMRQWEK